MTTYARCIWLNCEVRMRSGPGCLVSPLSSTALAFVLKKQNPAVRGLMSTSPAVFGDRVASKNYKHHEALAQRNASAPPRRD